MKLTVTMVESQEYMFKSIPKNDKKPYYNFFKKKEKLKFQLLMLQLQNQVFYTFNVLEKEEETIVP